MAPRRRTYLLALVLGATAAVLPYGSAGAAPAQDPGTEIIVGGQVGTESTTTSTTAAPTTTTAAAAATTTAPGTTVEEEPAVPKSTSTRLVTESRKVLAVIAGLVFVALAILLLTIRYWKATKPVAVTADEPLATTGTAQALAAAEAGKTAETSGAAPTEGDEADASVPVLVGAGAAAAGATPSGSVPSVLSPAPGTDHTAADDDWEPRTGEQERVEIPPSATLARPSRDARRKALGIASDA